MKKTLRVLVIALALVGIMVVPALAGPPAGAGAGKAPLYDSSGFTCPGGAFATEGPTFGFVIMNTNARGDLIVQVSLKGATPDATYNIWVNQDPGTCPLSLPTAPDALTTNGRGNGNVHVKVLREAGADNFWVSADGGGPVLRSTAVTLD